MPPSIPQRLPCCAGCACGADCWGAACCAGLAGAGVTLRCAPTERPPPSRLASASVATRLAPASTTHSPSNHLRIKAYLQLPMLSKADAAMHRRHACGKIEDFDLREASG